MQKIKLVNGVEIPILGYGVYQVTKEEAKRCVSQALEVGYRHIDTAQAYLNEEEVGEAIKESGIDRKEIFITSKVWIENNGYEACKKSVIESLRRLQIDYIDLMLIHQPYGDYYGSWRALEDLYEEGKIRAIGISNFYPDRLVDLCHFARIKPMINQVETHPLNQQIEAQKWMEKYNVQIESWGSFAEGRDDMFTNHILEEIGKKYHKSVAQVIIRWLIQRNIVVFPKTTHKERMVENFNVFDFILSEKDMELIASLDKMKSAFFSHQDPQMVEWICQLVEQQKKEHEKTK